MKKLNSFEELFLKNAVDFFRDKVNEEIKDANKRGENPILNENLINETALSIKDKLIRKPVTK